MGLEAILSVRVPMTIGTTFNFDGDCDSDGHGVGTCKHTLTLTIHLNVHVIIAYSTHSLKVHPVGIKSRTCEHVISWILGLRQIPQQGYHWLYVWVIVQKSTNRDWVSTYPELKFLFPSFFLFVFQYMVQLHNFLFMSEKKDRNMCSASYLNKRRHIRWHSWEINLETNDGKNSLSSLFSLYVKLTGLIQNQPLRLRLWYFDLPCYLVWTEL